MSDGYVCPECGLDYDTVSPGDAAVAVRSFPRRFREAIEHDEDFVRQRPEAGVWSALEYAAHVADLFSVFTESTRRQRLEDHPKIDTFWDPDERAVERAYNDMPVDAVLDDLQANATALADEIDRVPADAWSRMATFAWGDRDLLTMVRNAVHEGAHHLRDVERVLAAVTA